MLVDRYSENLSVLEKKQMATIDNLQEKIRILQVDHAQDNEEIRNLNAIIKTDKATFYNIIKKLEKIRDNQDMKELSNLIRHLKIHQKYDEIKNFE